MNDRVDSVVKRHQHKNKKHEKKEKPRKSKSFNFRISKCEWFSQSWLNKY